MVDRLLVLNLVDGSIPVVLKIYEARINEQLVGRLKQILQRHPGERPTRIEVETGDGRCAQYALPGFLVMPGIEFQTEVKELLGRGAMRL
jgi:hypothetical protein